MWKKPEKPISIDPSQIVLGLYIWIDLPWDDHPFLYARFKVSDRHQIDKIRTLPVKGKLFYYPEKSSAKPGALVAQDQKAPVATEPDPDVELARQMAQQKKEKQQQLQQRKDAAARADRAWEQAARVSREAMLGMARTPRQSGAQLMDLSQKTASMITQG